MKKALFGFCALLACFVFASCSGNPTERLKDLTKKIEDAKELSAKEVYNITKDGVKAQIDFYKSNPSDEEYDKFKDALNDYEMACLEMLGKVDDNFMKEAKEIDDKELDKLNDELKEAKKEYKKNKKDKKDKDKD